MKGLNLNYDGIPLEEKRRDLSLITRGTGNLIQRRRMRISWDYCSNGRDELCGHISLGRKGNIFTIYTPRKESKKKTGMAFDSVEIYVLNEKYWRLAYNLANNILEAGYEPGVRYELDDRILFNKPR